MKIGLVGSGYRAGFYLNIALQDKNIEIVKILCHSIESKEKMEKLGYKATICFNEFLKGEYDFVVVTIKKDLNYSMSKRLMDEGICVLQETPAFTNISDYNDIYNYKDKLMIAEQYKYYKYYQSLKHLIDTNVFGDIYEVEISEVHDYHMTSVIRYLFNLDLSSFSIYGSKYKAKITKTKDRYKEYHSGELKDLSGKHLVFDVDGIKIIYDFTGEEYRSPIRTKRLIIRGSRAELVDSRLRYLDEANEFKEKDLELVRVDEDLMAIREVLYLSYDKFINNKNVSIKNEVEDAYISCVMNEFGLEAEKKEIKL